MKIKTTIVFFFLFNILWGIKINDTTYQIGDETLSTKNQNYLTSSPKLLLIFGTGTHKNGGSVDIYTFKL